MAPKLPNMASQETETTQTTVPTTEARKDSPDDIVELAIDLGESTNKMTVNGVDYYHGMRYKIKRHQMPSFMEIMSNTRLHDEVVKGNRTVVGNRYKGNRR